MTSPAIAEPVSSGVQLTTGTIAAKDGTKLWYREESPANAEGPVLLCCNGVGVSVQFWEPVQQHFRGRFRTVLWDYRAHGQSEAGPAPEAASIEQCAEDASALLDGLDIREAVVFGHSMGTAVAFELLRRRRSRVVGLVPTLGNYANAIEGFFLLPPLSRSLFAVAQLVGPRYPDEVGRWLHRFVSLPGAAEAVRLTGFVHPSLCPREQVDRYLAHLAQLDMRVYFALLASLAHYDATDLLPTIDVPTLVVGGSRDLFAPARSSEEMARLIPEAELYVIQGGTHAAIVEQTELYVLRVEKFLRARMGLV